MSSKRFICTIIENLIYIKREAEQVGSFKAFSRESKSIIRSYNIGRGRKESCRNRGTIANKSKGQNTAGEQKEQAGYRKENRREAWSAYTRTREMFTKTSGK